MKIENGIQPSFGMAVKCNTSLEKIKFNLSTKLGPYKYAEANDIIRVLDDQAVTTDLSMNKRGRLIAKIGDKTFKENLFNGPLRVLKKALSYSYKKIAQDNATKVMSRPKL